MQLTLDFENVETLSVIKCPQCKNKEVLHMPHYSVKFFYECPKCKMIMMPEPGGCCIFCSYGSVPCPSGQKRK